jgi:hypothetical protein
MEVVISKNSEKTWEEAVSATASSKSLSGTDFFCSSVIAD